MANHGDLETFLVGVEGEECELLEGLETVVCEVVTLCGPDVP